MAVDDAAADSSRGAADAREGGDGTAGRHIVCVLCCVRRWCADRGWTCTCSRRRFKARRGGALAVPPVKNVFAGLPVPTWI